MNDWTEMNEKNFNSLQSCQISIINGNESVDDIVCAYFTILNKIYFTIIFKFKIVYIRNIQQRS